VTLNEALKNIIPADKNSMDKAYNNWLNIAKPLFSLGKLEKAVIKMAGIKRSEKYSINKKALIIMCADNGVVEEGVTQSTNEITAVVSKNFINNKASVCIMAQTAGADIFALDIGMASDVEGVDNTYKVAYGTKNIAKQAAMTMQQSIKAVEAGINKVIELKRKGYDIIAAGEMGIGNTTTSTAVICAMLDINPETITARGAGLSSAGLERKISVIKKAIEINKPDNNDPFDVLSKLGGFDIAGIMGIIIGGAATGIPIIIDGVISAAAALLAVNINPVINNYIIGSHISKEPASKKVIDILGIDTIIDAGMFLGEGSGAIAVMPILDMAYNVYSKMTDFKNWGADQKYKILE